jgi:hypothetical protein
MIKWWAGPGADTFRFRLSVLGALVGAGAAIGGGVARAHGFVVVGLVDAVAFTVNAVRFHRRIQQP